jgi:hypothetical protein
MPNPVTTTLRIVSSGSLGLDCVLSQRGHPKLRGNLTRRDFMPARHNF